MGWACPGRANAGDDPMDEQRGQLDRGLSIRNHRKPGYTVADCDLPVCLHKWDIDMLAAQMEVWIIAGSGGLGYMEHQQYVPSDK